MGPLGPQGPPQFVQKKLFSEIVIFPVLFVEKHFSEIYIFGFSKLSRAEGRCLRRLLRTKICHFPGLISKSEKEILKKPI